MAHHAAALAPAGQTGEIAPELLRELCVLITVQCDYDHVIGHWIDTVEEKYPFYCDECDEQCTTGKYPWKLTTRITIRRAYATMPGTTQLVSAWTPQEGTTDDLQA
jgi:hypothetical protein